MRKTAYFLLAFSLLSPARAEDKPDGNAGVKLLAPFLDERVVGVAHVSLDKVDVKALIEKIADVGKLDPKEVATAKLAVGTVMSGLRNGGAKEIYAVFSLADLPQSFFVLVPLEDGADAELIVRMFEPLKLDASETINKVLFIGRKTALERVKELKAKPNPELAKAFAAAGSSGVQAVFLPPADLRRSLEEAVPTLPKEVGGGSSKVLTRGFQWAAAGIDLPPQASVRLIVQAQDEGTAKDLSDLLAKVLKVAAADKQVKKVFPEAEKLVEIMTPKVVESRLTLTFSEKDLTAVIQPALAQVRTEAGRAQKMNNLKQIGLALHNYHATYNTFPPSANFDKKDKPLLSWRVHILPYIEQERLYKEFHLDEPWDSEHNKKLIAKMPAIYRGSTKKLGDEGKTNYVVPVGSAMLFTGEPKGIKLADISDGTSNTIMTVDADDDHAVIWTRPDDLKIDVNKPVTGLANRGKTGFMVGFADGSVRILPENIDVKTLAALFTRNGNEVVNVP